VIRAVFKGGPFDGAEMGISGGVPGYLMLMDGAPVGWQVPIVVGSGFDDHWPGQAKYVLDDELLDGVGEGGFIPTVVYLYEEP
jgi:hypothetical protein